MPNFSGQLTIALCLVEDPNVLEHLDVIRENLKKIGLADFRFQSTTNTKFFRDGREVSVRRYTLPKRLRQDDKTRLIFMQVFNGNRSYNWKLPGYAYKMVQVFEPRPVFHTTNEDYQGLAGLTEEDGVDGLARFSDPDLNELAAYNPPTAQPFPSPESQHDLDLAVLSAAPEQPVTLPTPRDEVEIPTTQRSRPIPKPDRHVRKNAHGKFECIHPGCDEDQKMFARKCEWK